MNTKIATLSEWLSRIHTVLVMTDKVVCFLQTILPADTVSNNSPA